MGEIIQIRELQRARERSRRRRSDYQHLAEALRIMRENLAAVAAQLRVAPEADQPELLDRLEKLAAMVRYGLAMMEASAPDDPLASRG